MSERMNVQMTKRSVFCGCWDASVYDNLVLMAENAQDL